MLLLDETCAWLLVWYVKFDANHEALSTHIDDMRQIACLHLSCESVEEELSDLGGILHEVFLFYDIEHGQCACTSEVVAAEGSAKLSVDRFETWGDEHSAHGESVADALRHSYDVWLHSCMLVGEELARTPVAALYLVEDKDGVVSIAKVAQTLEEGLVGYANAAHTLDALEDDSTYITLLYLFFPWLYVVERKVGDVTIVVDRGDNLRIVCCLDSERGASVESLLGREDASAAVVEGGELQRILVGLST